ncbi:host cell division inhibitory peptide Kil [Citrobacter werkmanii]|nr:host cell division inhibitory peptide Kil [Citrobacter werkmanii]MBJ9598078.1 host cell division inhibitory peptide Kil [Citrobacter werkmanii]
MTVTHNGRQYTVTRMADGHSWILVEVGNERHKLRMNRDQLIRAGLGHVVTECMVDTRNLRAALSKKAIARFIGDSEMLEQANEAQRKALGVRVNRNSFEVRV